MKMLYIVLMTLVLTACGGSSNPAFNDSGLVKTDNALQAQVAALQKQVADIQAAQSAQHDSLKKLQLVGKPEGTASAERVLAIGEAANILPSFGPCPDMGILVGFSGNFNGQSADALSSAYQQWRQCTGYLYGTNVKDGGLQVANRIFYDGPNCTGNVFTWEAAGAGYNIQTLLSGVVFFSPADNKAMMVIAGQTPKITQVQSAYIFQNGDCEVDGDLQPMYAVKPNDFNVTGVPDNGVGKYQLGSL